MSSPTRRLAVSGGASTSAARLTLDLPIDRFAAADWLDLGLAFCITGLFYIALYGELPYHDAERFTLQVENGHFVWDIAHIFLQPMTLIWHRLLGFGESAAASQKHIHTFAVALGVAVFMATMIRLRVARWQRTVAVGLLIGSSSLVILTPSAHMKLVVFPLLNGAIYFAVLWERKFRGGICKGDGDLVTAAILLAAATAFLASCLATAPFVALAAVAIRIVGRCRWRGSLLSGFRFAAVCGLVFAVLACVGFLLFANQPLSLRGFAGSITDKAELGPQSMSMLVRGMRSVFATANNLISAPVLGSTFRAWQGGEIGDLSPYYEQLADQLVPWALILGLITAIYLFAALAARRGAPCLMLLAFLAGAHAWSIAYSLNDPEHWFLLSVPTILLFLTTFPAGPRCWLLPIATVMVLATNLRLIALPTTLYPLLRYEAEVLRQFNDRDLLVSFAAYPGGPYLGFFPLRGIERLQLDQLRAACATPQVFYDAADAQILAALSRGGRVVVFGAFDPENWDAPWPNMARLGVPKAKLLIHFADRFIVRPLGEIAELKAWEIEPRP